MLRLRRMFVRDMCCCVWVRGLCCGPFIFLSFVSLRRFGDALPQQHVDGFPWPELDVMGRPCAAARTSMVGRVGKSSDRLFLNIRA